MRIAVLGANGNVGSRTVAEALARGHQVTAVVRGASRAGNVPDGATHNLGFAYELGNAIFLISRLPGLIAHAHEERTRQSPMRQIDPKDHGDDGAGQRRLPEGRK